MSVISLILVLALMGLIAWAVVRFIPMPPQIATLIYVVVGVVALLYVLQAFGLFHGVPNVPQVK